MPPVVTHLYEAKTNLSQLVDRVRDATRRDAQFEKLSALGRMSAGIIHEINNPLNYASAGLHALETFTRALPETEQAEAGSEIPEMAEPAAMVAAL